MRARLLAHSAGWPEMSFPIQVTGDYLTSSSVEAMASWSTPRWSRFGDSCLAREAERFLSAAASRSVLMPSLSYLCAEGVPPRLAATLAELTFQVGW